MLCLLAWELRSLLLIARWVSCDLMGFPAVEVLLWCCFRRCVYVQEFVFVPRGFLIFVDLRCVWLIGAVV